MKAASIALTVLAGSTGLSACAAASHAHHLHQDAVVVYRVSFPAPQTQRVEIDTVLPSGGRESLELRLPTWRPGRYSILNPVGTLRSIHAEASDGSPLELTQVGPSAWRVATGGADAVRVRTSLFADSLGDRTRHVDATHAFLSGSSVFLYDPELRAAPVRVELDLPAGWGVATGLEFEPGRTDVLVAADYDVLVDSPLELGRHDRLEFEAAGARHEIVIWPPGVPHDPERMTGDFAKIVAAQAEIFGRVPYERYVFLIHAGAGAGGGTEHLNSTIMQTSRGAIEGSRDDSAAWKRFLGLVAHEFFHTWNVKQLRPAGIHPYDYQNENLTDLLWLAEGGTSYFGDLSLARAGLTKESKYLDGLANSVDAMRRRPGSAVQSAAASSLAAWTHGGRSDDDVNTEVSFYSKGLLVSLWLDMELRSRSGGAAGMDEVFRLLFERYPLSGPGYTTDDLIAVLDELSGSSFAADFERYVSGVETLPLERVLQTAGLELRFEPDKDKTPKATEDSASEEPLNEEGDEEDDEVPLKAYIGLRLSGGGSGSTVSAVYSDGPAYPAGVLVGDEVIALDGRRLRSGDLDKRLEDLDPGASVTLHLMRRDELFPLEVTLAGIPAGKWTLKRVEEPSEAQRATYASWIGQPWPGDEAEGESTADDDGDEE